MRKETIVAIVLGILVGVFFAVGMVWQTRMTQMHKTNAIGNANDAVPTVSVGSSFQTLAVSQPDNGSIVNGKTVTIKGKVNKGSLIVIQSPIKSTAIKNDSEDFSADFPLAFGENVIHIVAYPSDAALSTQEKDLKIYNLDEQ